MKKIKFLPACMAMVLGLSFGLVSCGSDDDDNNGGENTSVVDSDVTAKGRSFYTNLCNTTSGDAATVASAMAAVVVSASEYSEHRKNNDDAWTTNFLAGVVMEKYGVSSETEAKSEENLAKVAELKSVLDAGVTTDNVANMLVNLANFIS